MTVAALSSIGAAALHQAAAQQVGSWRTELQQHDLGVPGRAVIQARAELDPGVTFGGTGIQGKRSSTSSKVRWNISSRANRQ
jgi:hypothetical protein